MSYQEPLSQHAVAISISESPDMAILGLGPEHLEDAMTEVARHLLAMGARLLYGGDLREHGFSTLLFELVTRHRRDADIGDGRIGVTNYLAWPVHSVLPVKQIESLVEALKGTAKLICLDQQGDEMPLATRQALAQQAPSPTEWSDGLTAMRRTMAAAGDARIVLGGRVENFKGRMPGVGEEALIALEREQPLHVLGGFGGCARDIATELGLVADIAPRNLVWPGRDRFAAFCFNHLRNGLSREENEDLARTVHIDEAVALVLRGLIRLDQTGGKETRDNG